MSSKVLDDHSTRVHFPLSLYQLLIRNELSYFFTSMFSCLESTCIMILLVSLLLSGLYFKLSSSETTCSRHWWLPLSFRKFYVLYLGVKSLLPSKFNSNNLDMYSGDTVVSIYSTSKEGPGLWATTPPVVLVRYLYPGNDDLDR